MKAIVFLGLALLTVTARAAGTNAPVTTATNYPAVMNPPHALARAGANACTFWMELPRNMVIENVKHPGMGVGSGLLKGLFFTTSRALLTVGDVMFLGFTGPSAYNPVTFPETVTAAQWNPYAPPTAAQKRVEEAEEKQYEAVESIDENMSAPL